MGGGGTEVNYPAPSADETALMQEQLKLLKQQQSETDAFKPILLSQFGLEPEYSYGTPSGTDISGYNDSVAAAQANIDRARASGDADALVAAQQKWRDLVSAGGPQGPRTLSGYKKTAEQIEKEKSYNDLLKSQNEITNLQLERQKKALAGDLPVSEGTSQRKAQEFQQFKEQMARAGNPVFGDTPEGAYSNTTAGIQALKAFQSNWKLVEDSERRGELTTGAQLLNQSVGLSSGLRSDSLTSPVIPDLGTGKMLPAYMSALQPYQMQRQGQFQANATNATNDAQREAGLMSLVGQGLGSGAALYALSSKDFKKDIEETDGKGSLEKLRKTKMYKYNYKDEPSGGKHAHMGFITEHSPREVVSPDGKKLDIVSTLGMLTSSIKELDAKMSKFKSRKKEAA